MPTVLVVDRDAGLAPLIREIAVSHGYMVLTAANGTEALGQLASAAPDLIVSDVVLEDMDGLDFHRRVQVLSGAAVPFVFLTTRASLKDRLDGLRSGADDYIVRPVASEELAARIAAVLYRVERTRTEERTRFESLKARTMHDVATELRQPVDDLVIQLNRLSEERINGDAGQQRDCLRRAIEDARRLGRAVDEMGWASSEGAEASLNSEPVRIAPIVRRSAASASRHAVDRNVQLSLSCGGLLSGNVDEAAMVRTLGSLLEAVVDFSPAGSEVSLHARRVQDMGLEFVIAEGNHETSGNGTPRPLHDALELARSVVRGHNGKFSVRRTEDGRQSYVLWVPGRTPRARHASH